VKRSDVRAGKTADQHPGVWRRRIVILALSSAAGFAYAIIVVGMRVLNPLDLSWLAHDPATSYLGWAFFRREAHLTFPLGWSGAIGYPFGEPAAYFDSIPLVAAVAWPFRGTIPEDFQYLGLYFVLCCILQFYFGFRISCNLCNGNKLAGLLGGGLFLIAPAFTWRAFGHFALTSHWLILAALDQLLRAPLRPSLAQFARSGVTCLVAGAINPYIAVMTLLLTSASYIKPVLCRSNCLGRSCAGVAMSLCAMLLGLTLFGFVRGSDASQYTGVGYGLYSMNLLAPIDPYSYGALLLRQQPSRPGQYEGYNYLGLGILLAGLVSVARKPSSVACLLARPTAPALAVFAISLLLALSAQATLVLSAFVPWHRNRGKCSSSV
jgi:hypothetical protein